MAKRKIGSPLTPEELAENEAAMKWLIKKGVSNRDIRFLKWGSVDQENKQINLIKKSKLGFRYRIRLAYSGSPMDVIAERNHGEIEPVFAKTIQSPKNMFHSYGSRYSDDDIQKLRKSRRKKSKKLLTIPAFLIKWNYWKHFYK